jgi:hypothetical protein
LEFAINKTAQPVQIQNQALPNIPFELFVFVELNRARIVKLLVCDNAGLKDDDI